MAWEALRANRLRSALTLGGMAVGVFSVIASVTAVTVLERTLLANLSAMGATTLTITRATMDGPPRDGEERRAPLTYAQAERLRDRARLAVSVSPSVQQFGEQVRGGGAQTDPNVTVFGTDADYAVNNGLALRAGRFVNADDVRTARAVAVLGSSLAERLFAGREAVGQEVRVGAQRLVVVGVLEPRSGGFGIGDPNNNLVAPVTRVLSAFGLFEADVAVDVRAPSPELLAATQDEVIGLLRAIRRVPPEAPNDFSVSSGQTFAEGFRSFTRALAIGGAGIGLIALLAAGVGVMNIMLVSVTERTREIGIRKALGATPRAIRRQFLVEAVLLCQVGGLAGVLLGVAGGNVAALLLRDAPAFPAAWAAGAFLGVTAVALLFGVYPAAKAARLNPIDALRYE